MNENIVLRTAFFIWLIIYIKTEWMDLLDLAGR
jgi:hypothetical protein